MFTDFVYIPYFYVELYCISALFISQQVQKEQDQESINAIFATFVF